ncbi:hypothetical protein [Actinoplanes sp. NPDC026670]|uniref:hypothetical protein n=1 Tax=Actinoplanes sp. NPDC026670 TaxID=3154700 RepID=UPI00340AAB5D
MPDPSSTPPPLVSVGPNGIYASGETGSEGNVYDYTDKDWKWIEAVLTGSSAVNNADGAATAAQNAASLVNPESLRTAGNIFNTTQSVMRGVAQNLAAQVKGLSGEGRAWQGTAAETFKAKMLDVANYLERQAERINGGSGDLGVSVPNQLFHSGNMLEWAQKEVLHIDHFYASWASQYVKDYGDGVVHVSEVDGLPEIMTNAMREVMGKLVTEYVRLGTSAVNTPQPMNAETGGPGAGGSTPPPPSGLPSSSVPSYSPPPFQSSSLPPTPSISSSAPPAPTTPPAPSTGPVPSASGGPAPTPPTLSADAPDEVTGGPDAPGPSAADIPDPAGADVPDPPGAPGADPPAFASGGGPDGGLPGFDSGASGPGTGANVPIPPVTGSGTPNPNGNGKGGTATPPVPEFDSADPPGAGGGGGGSGASAPGFGAAGDAPGAGAPDPSDAVIPPLTSVDAPVDTGAGGPAGSGSGSGIGSPPMLPPMTPPQSGTGTTDRSDSSGLVGGDAEDWQTGGVPGAPDTSGGAAPGAGSGVETPGGGTVPAVPGFDSSSPGAGSGGALGSGVQTPVLPPMAPPQSGTGATERPDSSGLVGGDAEDWEPGSSPGAPEASGGAAPGLGGSGSGPGAAAGAGGSGTGLSPVLPPVESPGVGNGPSGLGSGVQTPVLPPMTPPQSGTGATDRPDSSGLVGGDAQDWEPESVPGAPEAVGGAAPGAGGPGSGLPSAIPAAESPGAGLGPVPVTPIPGPGTPAPGAGVPATGSGVQTPIMPPMTPPQSQRGTADRSDSSALVDGTDVPWERDSGGGTPDAPAGAEPGHATETGDPVPADGGQVPPPLPVALVAVPQMSGRDRDDPPLVLPPLIGDVRQRPERRSQSGELLAEERPSWAAAGDLPPDHVAMVRESDDDFGSWDSEPLPWEIAEEDDPSSWGGPEPEENVVPALPDEPPLPPPTARPRPSGQSYEALLLAEMPIRSGGPDLSPDDRDRLAAERAERVRRSRIDMGLDRDDSDEEEPAERRAADLLDRDATDWGDRDDTVGGVIG